MSMVSDDFAITIKNSLGFSSLAVSDETIAFATAIIDEIKAGTFSHASVTGSGSDGSPLLLGTALSGVVAGIVGSSLSDRLKTEMGRPISTPQLAGLAEAIASTIMLGLVNFTSGEVTGLCVSGSLIFGQASGGEIAGISGSVMATTASTSLGGVTSLLSSLCNAIADYIMDESESSYSEGTVTGTYPTPAGGPFVGSAVGGEFS